MLQVCIPPSRTEIEKQIKALKIALRQDNEEKDKQIHRQALSDLEKALEKI